MEQLQPSIDDRIYFGGDLFDRGADCPDPVGVYFKLSVIQASGVWLRGNHDHWLAEADMLNMAERIRNS